MAIPWATILRQAPMLLTAADALLSRSRGTASAVAADVESMEKRVIALERNQQANAELVKQIADQVNALTLAAQESARRARIAAGLAGAALAVSLGALVLAWLV